MNSPTQLHGTVLVVGADGMVGSALFKAFGKLGPVLGTSRRVDSEFLQLDLPEDVSGWRFPENISVAFLCAAVTSLQSCRENPATSWRVNVDSTVALARRLVARGARVILFSTGLVFDGSQSFWRETDTVNPQCEYGRQKAEAEREILALGDAAAVVRLTKVIAPGIPVFRRWQEDLAAGNAIRPFTDYRMSPITVDFVATAMQSLVKKWLPGVLHLSADYDLDYSEVALQLAMKLDPTLNLMRLVQPTTSRSAGVDLEILPQFTTLDTTRLRTELGLTTPSATQSLADCFASL